MCDDLFKLKRSAFVRAPQKMRCPLDDVKIGDRSSVWRNKKTCTCFYRRPVFIQSDDLYGRWFGFSHDLGGLILMQKQDLYSVR
jgi:hypothetical protein